MTDQELDTLLEGELAEVRKTGTAQVLQQAITLCSYWIPGMRFVASW